jgi:hypothetical protein
MSKGRREEGRVGAILGSADLGDARLSRRVQRIAEDLEREPSASFPAAFGDGAELEGAYRFFSNERVTAAAILAPHFAETVEAASALAQVIIVHDTTEFEFSGEVTRQGLGRLLRSGQGFFGHFALAVAPDGTRRPLGLLGLETVFRLDEKRKPRGKAALRRDAFESEKGRWPTLVEDCEARLAGRATAIHVMDREADGYLLIDHLVGTDRQFVIRAQHDRYLAQAVDGAKRMHEAALGSDLVLSREVTLSPRKKSAPMGKGHPTRSGRPAQLAITAASVTLPVPASLTKAEFAPRRINVVCVTEPNPPDGEPPVEWMLVTTLPIETPEQIAFVVDVYRARWLIEEYFKVLKTGCQYEKRQLESAHALLNVLAVLAPIACRLLLLRHCAHHAPDTAATEVLSPTQIEVLRALGKRPLGKHPTVLEALFAVAGLGGHIRNNGDPGWMVLGRGFDRLLVYEIGWSARNARM